jgi:hypothetical protein
MKNFMYVSAMLLCATGFMAAFYYGWALPGQQELAFHTDVTQYVGDVSSKATHRLYYLAGDTVSGHEGGKIEQRLVTLDKHRQSGGLSLDPPDDNYGKVMNDLLNEMVRAERRKVRDRMPGAADRDVEKVVRAEHPEFATVEMLSEKVTQVVQLRDDRTPLAERRVAFEKLQPEIEVLMKQLESAEPLKK